MEPMGLTRSQIFTLALASLLVVGVALGGATWTGSGFSLFGKGPTGNPVELLATDGGLLRTVPEGPDGGAVPIQGAVTVSGTSSVTGTVVVGSGTVTATGPLTNTERLASASPTRELGGYGTAAPSVVTLPVDGGYASAGPEGSNTTMTLTAGDRVRIGCNGAAGAVAYVAGTGTVVPVTTSTGNPLPAEAVEFVYLTGSQNAVSFATGATTGTPLCFIAKTPAATVP